MYNNSKCIVSKKILSLAPLSEEALAYFILERVFSSVPKAGRSNLT